MIKTNRLIQYLSNEEYYDKLITLLEKKEEGLSRQLITIGRNEAVSGSFRGLDLCREEQKIIFSIYGFPLSIAAYAGNDRMVDYLIQAGFADEFTAADSQDDEEYYNDVFSPGLCCTMITENEESYYELNEYFKDISPISYTLPGGKLECFKLLTKAGLHCDFRSRKNFKLLSFCRNRAFWEYLIDSEYLDRSLLLMAADYACYYRNTEIAGWLIKHYKLLQDYIL